MCHDMYFSYIIRSTNTVFSIFYLLVNLHGYGIAVLLYSICNIFSMSCQSEYDKNILLTACILLQ